MSAKIWRDGSTHRWYATVDGRILLTSGYDSREDAVRAVSAAERAYAVVEPATALAPADRAALEDELVEIEAERGRLSRRSERAGSRTARSVLQTEYEALGSRAYEILAILKADHDSSGPR